MTPGINPVKRLLGRVLDVTGLSRAGHVVQAATLRPFVRAVNYHAVPASEADLFERHLRYFATRFSPVGLGDLLDLLAGRWTRRLPGLLLSFDDGLRSHYDVVAPLLERYGWTGWFFVPAGLVGLPIGGREAVATYQAGRADDDGPAFLDWPQARRLADRHLVGGHTLTHSRLAADTPEQRLREEIVDAKRMLEDGVGREVCTFAWVGGEERSYSRRAAELVRDAGFTLGFMTNNAVIRPGTDSYQLQRTNLEASYPLWLVRFQLSGCLDLLYTAKRRRVNVITAR